MNDGRYHMPYIAIKAFPKDEKTKQETVDKINQVFLETWGCPQRRGDYCFLGGNNAVRVGQESEKTGDSS